MEFQIASDGDQRSHRLGTLRIGTKAMQTPAFVNYTSLGSIPHLTPDVVAQLPTFGNTLSSLVALESFIPLVSSAIRLQKSPLAKKGKWNHLSVTFKEKYKSLHAYLVNDGIIFGDLRDTYQWMDVEPQLPMTDHFASTSTLAGYASFDGIH